MLPSTLHERSCPDDMLQLPWKPAAEPTGNSSPNAARLSLRRKVAIVSWSGWNWRPPSRTPSSRCVACSIRRLEIDAHRVYSNRSTAPTDHLDRASFATETGPRWLTWTALIYDPLRITLELLRPDHPLQGPRVPKIGRKQKTPGSARSHHTTSRFMARFDLRKSTQSPTHWWNSSSISWIKQHLRIKQFYEHVADCHAAFDRRRSQALPVLEVYVSSSPSSRSSLDLDASLYTFRTQKSSRVITSKLGRKCAIASSTCGSTKTA